ncbi:MULTISPECIES: gluconokinase [unclassified Sphingomonas]|jgi:gluconokinase|uniref:gluconokinase n=1 Tax=unclassified Sphingomonas TaxID=196159 RepID=UPI0002E261A1|nr:MULTISPECIES: gluconokinase [unclassified Sphingomonas]
MPERRAGAVIVMGVSGCGKSTLGALLADALGCPFLEGDAFHSEAAVAKMRGGQPLTDADRWPWLDRLGSAMAETVAAHGIAVGACSSLRIAYRERLRRRIGGPVQFVLLDAAREALLARMQARPGHFMPPGLLDSQLATLERPGAAEAALTLAADAPAPLLCDAVLAHLRAVRA